MQIGDHLVSPRIGYTHHGIYIGGDNVIHYGGYGKSKIEGVITITSLAEFSQNNAIWVKRHNIRIFTREESVRRAYTRLGEDWYNFVLNNCEHFVTWCIYGVPYSHQVDDFILGATGYCLIRRNSADKVSAPTTLNSLNFVNRTIRKTKFSGSAYTPPIVSSRLKVGLTVSAGGLCGGTSGLVLAGVTATTTLFNPLVVAVAIGWLVDYGIKKLFD